MRVIGPVESHYHEGSPVGKRSLLKLRWEGFVEKVGSEPGVMVDKSGDDEKDGLTSVCGGE